MENKTTAQVQAEAMTAVRSMYPTAPDPIWMTRTQWKADPYSLGAYSFNAVGVQTPGDFNAVIGPFNGGRLIFAGEHTSVNYYGTMTGAYNTGRSCIGKLLGGVALKGNSSSSAPTRAPTLGASTRQPTRAPTRVPTVPVPTRQPSRAPSRSPSRSPTSPTRRPTNRPTRPPVCK